MQDEDFIITLAMLRFRAQVSYAKHMKAREDIQRAFNMTRSFLESGYARVKAGQGSVDAVEANNLGNNCSLD